MTLPPSHCAGCGSTIALRVEGGRFVGTPCKCVSKGAAPPTPKGKGSSPGGERAAPAPTFSNAKKTVCAQAHRHDSKMEAGVCDRLTRECAENDVVLVRQVPMPLLILPREDGSIPTVRVDFAILRRGMPGLPLRLIEAKHPKRISRDWRARARACELSWGLKIEECSE